jgi:NADH:ubiquinone oxidoreductase subunit 6 (subunit J)
VIDSIVFGIAAACALASALFVVQSDNLVHAALWLGVTLLSTAGVYAILGASLLAGVQVLLYVGGVVTLVLFGVMITRKHEGIVVRAESRNRVRGGAAAVALFAVVAAAIRRTEGLDAPPRRVVELTGSTEALGRSLLGEYVLAFEVLSLLLLVSIIGAIVIARRRDPEPAGGSEPRAAHAEVAP